MQCHELLDVANHTKEMSNMSKKKLEKRTSPIEVFVPDTKFQRKLYSLGADPQFCAWVWDKNPRNAWELCENIKEIEWQSHFLYEVKLEDRIASFLYALKESLYNSRLSDLILDFVENNYDMGSIKTGNLNKKHKIDSYVLKTIKSIHDLLEDIRIHGTHFLMCEDLLITEVIEDEVSEIPTRGIDIDVLIGGFDLSLISFLKEKHLKHLGRRITTPINVSSPIF